MNELSPTIAQQQVLYETMELIDGHTANDNPLTIAIQGISGVGKSTVLKMLEKNLPNSDVRYVEPNFIYRPDMKDPAFKYDGHIITTVIPNEMINLVKSANEVSEEHSSYKRHLVTLNLKGMTLDEASKFIEGKLPVNELKMSKDELASGSLGIPLLIDWLKSYLRMDAKQYKQAVGSFLSRNFYTVPKVERRSLLQQLSSIGISQDYADFVENENRCFLWNSIDELLHVVLSNNIDLKSKGVDEESPIFIAEESMQIYSKMFNNRENRCHVDIYVTGLSSENYQRIHKAIIDDYPYNDSKRMKMFFATSRKVKVLTAHDGVEEYSGDEHYLSWVKDDIKPELKSLYKSLPVSEKEQSNWFVISSHEHEGMGNPALIGWSVESLLQHMGVPYVVDNMLHGSLYWYNPKNQSINYISR